MKSSCHQKALDVVQAVSKREGPEYFTDRMDDSDAWPMRFIIHNGDSWIDIYKSDVTEVLGAIAVDGKIGVQDA